ncbi:MAG: RNA methyltransferase [Eubacteriales bacterium]|nr:RNA methyltransferase [Eubacteriales bacterium]MDY3332680.1 RNA methyltransferase [Gallibacter sp.]
MKLITSKDNKIFKIASSLANKKYRDKLGLYIVEGAKFVDEACKYNNVKTLIIDPDFKGRTDYDVDDKVFMMGELFNKLAQTENSQGILAIVEKELLEREEFIKSISVDDANVLVLDRLQDPGNVGTIIRTAEAAGIKDIIVVKGNVDIFSPKVVRSATSSVGRMNFYFAEDEKETLEILQAANKRVIVTDMDGENCFESKIGRNTALILGSEGDGVSQTFIDYAQMKVSIPMDGEIESLNVAVAAGILMYCQRNNKEGF